MLTEYITEGTSWEIYNLEKPINITFDLRDMFVGEMSEEIFSTPGYQIMLNAFQQGGKLINEATTILEFDGEGMHRAMHEALAGKPIGTSIFMGEGYAEVIEVIPPYDENNYFNYINNLKILPIMILPINVDYIFSLTGEEMFNEMSIKASLIDTICQFFEYPIENKVKIAVSPEEEPTVMEVLVYDNDTYYKLTACPPTALPKKVGEANWTLLSTINDKDTPTEGFIQVPSDWNAESGVEQILNKPTIPNIPTQPGTGTYILKSIEGVLQWVEDTI